MIPASRGRNAAAAAVLVAAALVAVALIAAAGVIGVGPALLAKIIRRVTVEGSSMEPLLAAGDRLLLLPVGALRPGDIVALSDPRNPDHLLVKRVKSVDRRNRLVMVEGDNLDRSTDSRNFGPVARQTVLGRAVYRYAPARRVGPVGRGR